MRSLQLQKYINLESLKVNKHHLERLLASRPPESTQIHGLGSLPASVSATHPSSPVRREAGFCPDVSPAHLCGLCGRLVIRSISLSGN